MQNVSGSQQVPVQVKVIRSLPGTDFTMLSELEIWGAEGKTIVGVEVVAESDLSKRELVANMGALYGATTIGTLGGYYTELEDKDNLLGTGPT